MLLEVPDPADDVAGPDRAPSQKRSTVEKRTTTLAALVLTAAALGGCAKPVTHMPQPSARSVQEMQTAFRTFDAGEREREVGPGQEAAYEAVARVWRRTMPAAERVCARYFSGGCEAAFRSMKMVVHADSEEVNAYAALDGTLGFYGGLVRTTGNDDELAAVVAHEAAHILFGHNQKTARNEGMGMLGGLLAGVAVMAGTGVYGEGMQDMTDSFIKAGGAAGRVAYSPEMELEADHFAIFALAEAGYDPEKGGRIFVRMLRTAQADQEAGRRSFVSYFRTHPADDHRLAMWQEGVARVRDGHRHPMSLEEMRETKRRRAALEEREAWRKHGDARRRSDAERWELFHSEECRRVRAQYPDCPDFTGKADWTFQRRSKCPFTGQHQSTLRRMLGPGVPLMKYPECVCPERDKWKLSPKGAEECGG